MRTIKIIEHVSLDGVMQSRGGPGEDDDFPYGEWTAPYRSPAGLALVLEAHGGTFDLLLGRKTYDMWSGYWPNAAKSAMADALNAATKFVVTHRPESLGWGPFKAVGQDLVENVRRIKATDGPNLIVSGSSTLTSPLIEHGLADEVLLLTYPVLIGAGKRFFAQGTPPRALTLESSRTTPSGIVANLYKAPGRLKNLS